MSKKAGMIDFFGEHGKIINWMFIQNPKPFKVDELMTALTKILEE